MPRKRAAFLLFLGTLARMAARPGQSPVAGFGLCRLELVPFPPLETDPAGAAPSQPNQA